MLTSGREGSDPGWKVKLYFLESDNFSSKTAPVLNFRLRKMVVHIKNEDLGT